MYCTVVTASRSQGIGNGLSYDMGSFEGKPGMGVRVPLRKQSIEGIIIEVLDKREENTASLKRIDGLLHESALLTDSQLQTVRWMAGYYMTTLRQAMSVWLPPPPWGRIFPQPQEGYCLECKPSVELRGKKQQSVVEYLAGKDWVSWTELRQETGVSRPVVNQLLTHHYLRRELRTLPHMQCAQSTVIQEKPSLTPDQRAAFLAFRSSPKPALLFGVTSSGKTEVYAQAIADAVAEGKQAILLVPEILLTEHSIARFERLLHRDSIAVLHSKLTARERYEAWKRIHSGSVSLVIGSRSALFAPLQHLGLIIIDEEHEWTYKNEQAPRYHVRETAEVLARASGAKLLFGSATPSLETWMKAKNGTYELLRLQKRYNDHSLPTVRVVDLTQVDFGKSYPFSPPLVEAVQSRLQRGEQSVLFLNRRGMASGLLCFACRRRVICSASQLPFTVHHANNGAPYLFDHSTGMRSVVPSTCPHCGSVELKEVGAGTQKLEKIISDFFPNARVLRADADTLSSPEEIREVLRKMRMGEADILLGTQSVVKGLDLPQVTLAAVLIADLGMSLPHFRAGERVFQLLTQLTGRSGRSQPGEVIIQTFRPDSPEVFAAANHTAETYLDTECKLRAHALYPPFTKMIRLIYRGARAEERARQTCASLLSVRSTDDPGLSITASPTFFGGGNVWHILVRGISPRSIVERCELNDAFIDVDPLETM